MPVIIDGIRYVPFVGEPRPYDQSALDIICEKLWLAAEEAIKPLGDERYYFSDWDRDEAIAAMKVALQELLVA